MIESHLGYASYLLRLWQVNQNGKATWRASLESTRTGTRQNFASLGELFAFLEQHVGMPVPPKRRPRKKATR